MNAAVTRPAASNAEMAGRRLAAATMLLARPKAPLSVRPRQATRFLGFFTVDLPIRSRTCNHHIPGLPTCRCYDERKHSRCTCCRLWIVQSGFFFRKKPFGLLLSPRTRVENAVAGDCHARSPCRTDRRFSPLGPRHCRRPLPGESPARNDVWRAGAALPAVLPRYLPHGASSRATAS